MLVQFTVENFASFGATTTFSMAADNADRQHVTHIIGDKTSKTPPVLRVAALYGANGAGKSNLIKAIGFARKLILNGTRAGKLIPITPFKLSSDSDKPSRFEFIFNHNDIPYSYGFLATATRIVEEWLYATPSKQEVRYFERTTSEHNETLVEFGATFTGKSTKDKQFMEFVAQGTRPNQLFLTEARERNVKIVAPVVEWFEKSLIIISADAQLKGLELMLRGNTDFADYIGARLRAAGTGVESVRVEEHPLEASTVFSGMPEEVQQEIAQSLQPDDEEQGVLMQGSFGERGMFVSGKQSQPMLLQIKTQHRGADGRLVDFDTNEESEGTQRLMHLFPALHRLQERPCVALLDELDRRLHPLLSRYFVETMLDCPEENRYSQLIFTTHETHLLDLDLLRRDEIWFVEKDRGGASHLSSLAEFNIRPELKVQKGYLNGRFGAIPFLGDPCQLGLPDRDETHTRPRETEATVGV